MGGSPGSTTVVTARSYEAKAYGITNGMPMFMALRLCPQLTVVDGCAARHEEITSRTT